MSLNEEIQQLLNSYSLPADVGRQMGEAMARVDANRVAPGLEVGERAPDFRLPNAAGQDVSLEERLSQGPVVLTFYRGAWCPICNLQLLALHRAVPDVRSLGASVIAVAPGRFRADTRQHAARLRPSDRRGPESHSRVPVALSGSRRGALDLHRSLRYQRQQF